jgi:hypothetical protein
MTTTRQRVLHDLKDMAGRIDEFFVERSNIMAREEVSSSWADDIQGSDDDAVWLLTAVQSLLHDARDYVEQAVTSDVQYINVYEVSQEYGGPEEGGWWFEAGYPVVSEPFRGTDDELDARVEQFREQYADNGYRFSVRPKDADYRVVVEDERGQQYPTERPHYE